MTTQRGHDASRTWAERLGTRLQRARPDLLPTGPRELVILGWVASFAALWVCLLPFPFPVLDALAGAPLVLDAPSWLRALMLAAVGVLAATTIGWAHAARWASTTVRPARWVTIAVVAAAAGVIPLAGLLQLRSSGWQAAAAAVAAVAILASVVASALLLTRGSGLGPWMLLPAVSAAAPWWLATATAEEPTPTGAGSLWVMLSIAVVQSALITAFYGFASAGARRVDRLSAAVRRPRSRLVVTLVLVAVVTVLVARLTVARELFGADDAGTSDADFWRLRGGESLPATLLVAALIVWFAVRSDRRPLRPRGYRRILLLLTAGYAFGGLALIAMSTQLLVVPILGGEIVDLGSAALLITPVLVLAVLLLTVFLLPGFRGSSGRAVATVALAYLLPGTMAPILLALWPELPTIWATPVPVVVAVTAIVAVVVIAQWFGRLESIPRSALLRLLVYPIVVLHAAVLIPDVFGDELAAVVGIVLIVVNLLFLLPPVAASRARHSAVLLRESSLALFALIGLALAAESREWQQQATVFSMLVLAVPVMAALTIRVDSDRSPLVAADTLGA